MIEFFKSPAAQIDAAQIGNLLSNALEGQEPKTAKDEKAKAAWRLGVIKSPKGLAVSKALEKRLEQNVSFMLTQNQAKNVEMQGVEKAFTEKATKDLKKQFDDLTKKSLDEAVSVIKKLAKAS